MDTVIEIREVPKWVSDRITSKGGLNPYGEPNFRVVWGGSRTYQVGGMFKHVVYVTDPSGNKRGVVTEIAEVRTLLKYNPHRWHMERWRGPEYYGTREEWYRNTWDEVAQLHTMGDYPSRGDYEHVFYLAQCPHMKPEDTEWCMPCQVGFGEYIPLEPNVFLLERQIYALLKSEDVSNLAEMGALFMRENIKRQIRNKIVGERVRNAMRPKLAVQPTSWQGGTNSRCSVPEAKCNDYIPLPANRRGFAQSDHAMPNHKEKEN
ncbi:hypothetical protein KGP36_03320 [Patescibacteria group bacterium]|nr:hypothetical protein [Patescibacteria group bacterium]